MMAMVTPLPARRVRTSSLSGLRAFSGLSLSGSFLFGGLAGGGFTGGSCSGGGFGQSRGGFADDLDDDVPF